MTKKGELSRIARWRFPGMNNEKRLPGTEITVHEKQKDRIEGRVSNGEPVA